ncbi:unnamed protein product [Rotaria sp. Silwood2]|nr:unnamed protein product [Rotaria sp. Silwood2]CAF3078152.1 unnamed protein product [Rotaria sp. Silwood2]CAF3283031.1 unnamed protein product [Rotaria sp. Silwood2]CAF4148496.1 unnamed protein product [Rotaria sp. Silwood2]CAF4211025.1 unnamed protein product [Rotaria sp. Silwood2]
MNNSTSTTNKEIQQIEEHAMLPNNEQQSFSAIMEYQYGQQSHYFGLEQLARHIQGKELFEELEDELWNELEKLEQNEEKQKEKKRKWQELCLDLFELDDEFNEEYMQHQIQNTPVENMEDEQEWNVEPSSIQHKEKIKEDVTFGPPGFVEAFEHFGVYEHRN